MDTTPRSPVALLLLVGCVENGLHGVEPDASQAGRILTADPASLDFGFVDGASSTLPVRLTAVGDLPVAVSEIAVSGAGAFGVTVPEGGVELASGESLDVVVTYTPASASDAGSLVVVSDASDPRLLVPLLGSGAFPALTVDPGSLAFETTGGSPVTSTLSITSVGTTDLEIADLAVEGAGFSADADLPLVLAPGEQASIEVTYAPPAESETVTGRLWLTTNTAAPYVTVPLAGTNVAVETCDPDVPFVASVTGTVRSPCSYDVSAILGLGGDVYASVDGSAMTLLFPDGTTFAGEVDGSDFEVRRETDFDWEDGCHWRAVETLTGTIAPGGCTMSADYDYFETHLEGTDCARGCTIDADILFDRSE